MATIGQMAATFNDLKKRQAPDGTIDHIIEVLHQVNPIMQDIPWMAGNLPTGNLTTQRTSLPEASLRAINRGVPATKSSTKQITDTCCLLEARSEVDIELIGLQPNPQAFRQSEDDAFVEGMAQQVASYMFYGDSSTNMDEFNGLGVRYANFGGVKDTAAYQVINAGGTTADAQSSAWLVGFGDRAVTGIYPKYGYAGLKFKDLGEIDAIDADGYKFRALSSIYTWKPGLSVRDPRMVAAVRNIDTAALALASTTSAAKQKIVECFVKAKNRMRKLDGVNAVWYVSDETYSFLECYLIDKTNVHVTRETLQDGGPMLRIAGIPVKKVDALLNTEPIVASL